MKKSRRGIVKWFTTHRPLTVIGLVDALKDTLYGLGLIFAWEDVIQTTMYALIVDSLNPVPLGVLMILLGAFYAYSIVTLKDKLIGLSSISLSMVWLYVAFIFALNGNWFLAFAIGLLFSVVPAYLGFALRNKYLWTEHSGQEWKDK